MPAVRCVVFDFDGVLVDSNAVKRDAYFEIFRAIPGSSEIIRRVQAQNPRADRFGMIELILRGLEDERLLPRGLSIPTEVARYAEAYNDRCESYASTCSERPGAGKMLAALSAQLPLFINSDTPQEPLQRIVKRRGWAGYFRGVYGRPAKKADTLRRIYKEANTTGPETLFFGDGARDEDAASDAGCRFARIASDGNDFRDSSVPLLSTVEEIQKAVFHV